LLHNFPGVFYETIGPSGTITVKQTMKKIKCDFAGEKNGNAKLTLIQVEQIIHLHSSGYYTHRKLAELANVSKSQVYRIIKGKSWTSVKS
jgi:hypothetical protein